MSSTGWRQRRRRSSQLAHSTENSSSDSAMMDTLSLSEGADSSSVANRHGRGFLSRHAKRARLVDLDASFDASAIGGAGAMPHGGMFGRISLAEARGALPTMTSTMTQRARRAPVWPAPRVGTRRAPTRS